MKSESWLPALWGNRSSEPDPFRALRTQVDSLFDDWIGAAGGARRELLSPRLNVSETEKELRITAELPGVEQKDLVVTLIGDQLTISGEKKHEQEQKEEKEGRHYHRIERSYGSFKRTIAVPYDCDPAKVAAQFKDGVLTVTLPKPAEAQGKTRRIEVRAG